jgi:hypothetical protein
LTRLLAETGAEIPNVISADELSAARFDFHVPLLSLPFELGIYEPLPWEQPYIHASQALRRMWRDRIDQQRVKRTKMEDRLLRVGLAWAGNPNHRLNRFRSVSPETLAPLLQTTKSEFYSLQIGQPRAGIRALTDAGLIDLTEHINDFADTAAYMAELDIIISVDTAVAHLAGALGRPVWTLLPFQGDWRWGLSGERTPWYPSMRLFRQPAIWDWEAVVQRVAAELESLAMAAARK